jgi:hypothetical protein
MEHRIDSSIDSLEKLKQLPEYSWIPGAAQGEWIPIRSPASTPPEYFKFTHTFQHCQEAIFFSLLSSPPLLNPPTHPIYLSLSLTLLASPQ